MSGESPSTAYNPRDRIKKLLKRKSSSRNLGPALDSSLANRPKVFPDIETESCPAPSFASNPFKVGSPLKKRRPPQISFEESVFNDEENAQDPFGDNVFSYSNTRQPQKTPIKSPRKTPRKSPRKKVATKPNVNFERFRSFDPTSLLKECYPTDFSQLFDPNKKLEKREEELEEQEDIPLDLRIATKLRITCQVPFSWMNSRKTTGIVAVRVPASDRYEGLRYFNERFMRGKEDLTTPEPCSPLALLEAATMFWQFPIVPGMSLYPRITSHLGTIERTPLPPNVTTTMFNQWVECYEQLFHSYKKGDRESFYVSCAVFNVLFTKTFDSDEIDINEDSQSCFRSSNGQKMIAIVTHTTSAVREHLRSQGVNYEIVGKPTMKRLSSSMNLNNENSIMSEIGFESNENSILSNSLQEAVQDKENSCEEAPKDSESDENESPTKANQQWLKDIGVSPKNVIRNHVTRKLSSRLTDKDGISCLLVKGSSVQSLYNTLMSSDIVHEKTGPYTKIPPTLIASSPFLYGQLLSLNKTSHIVQKPGSKVTEYVVELDRGPILPHTSNMVLKYLRCSKLCTDEKSAQIRATDRHANNGMNGWTDRALDWTMVQIYPNCVKWSKSQ